MKLRPPSVLALTILLAGTAAIAQTAAPVAAPAPAYTLSYNVGAVSDYRFRGISQTSFKPALQAGIDFAHKDGFYVGAWGTNVNWIKDYVGATDGSLEVDLYAGYKGAITADFGFDVGVIGYQYPSNTAASKTVDANTTEAYGALTYRIYTVKYSQSTGNFVANANSSGSRYLEVAANFDLGNGLSVTPHAGRQTIPNANNAGDYTDFSLTLAKDFGKGVSASIAALSTNAGDGFYKVTGFDNLGKSTAVLGLKYSF